MNFCLRLFFLWLGSFFFFPAFSSIAAEPPPASDTQFFSATSLGASIADWVLGMPEKPNSIAVFGIRTKAPLTSYFTISLETEITKTLTDQGDIRVQTCLQCRSLRANVVDDQVIISRGAPSLEEFKKIAQEIGVEAFLLIETRRATTSTTAAVEMYSGDGHLLASRNFSEQVLDLDGSSAMLGGLATVGLGIGGRESDGNPSGAADVFLLQELGGGRKGGLVIGGFGGNGGGGGYAIPTLAWIHRKAAWGLRGMGMFGMGPGASTKGYGLAARASYQLFLGFCLFGAEATGMVPISSKDGRDAADVVLGMNIGVVFGR